MGIPGLRAPMAAGGLSPAADGAVDCVVRIARRVGSPSCRVEWREARRGGPGSHCLQTVGKNHGPGVEPGQSFCARLSGRRSGRAGARGRANAEVKVADHAAGALAGVRRSGRCLRYRRQNGEFGSVLVALTDRRAKKILGGRAIVLTRLEAPAVQADEAGRARRAGAAVEAAGGVRLLPERHAGPLGAAAERAAGGRAATAVAGAARPGRAAHPGAVGGGAGAGGRSAPSSPPAFSCTSSRSSRSPSCTARRAPHTRRLPPRSARPQGGNRAGEQSPNQSAPVGTERDGQRIEAVCILVDTPFPYMRSRGFGRMSSDVQCGRCRFGAGTVTRSSQAGAGGHAHPKRRRRQPQPRPGCWTSRHTLRPDRTRRRWRTGWPAGNCRLRGCRQSPSGAPERKCTGSARCRRRRLWGAIPAHGVFRPAGGRGAAEFRLAGIAVGAAPVPGDVAVAEGAAVRAPLALAFLLAFLLLTRVRDTLEQAAVGRFLALLAGRRALRGSGFGGTPNANQRGDRPGEQPANDGAAVGPERRRSSSSKRSASTATPSPTCEPAIRLSVAATIARRAGPRMGKIPHFLAGSMA